MGTPPGRRRPRRAGRATSDADRRRLAKASGRRASSIPPPPAAAGPVAWCDGGSRGNPGPSAYAYLIESADGRLLAEHAEPIGFATVNVAEYRGIIAALERAAELGLPAVEVRMDSRLVVQQLLGLWTVRSPHLRRLHELALEAASQLDLVGYRWVPREQNARADALVAAVLT